MYKLYIERVALIAVMLVFAVSWSICEYMIFICKMCRYNETLPLYNSNYLIMTREYIRYYGEEIGSKYDSLEEWIAIRKSYYGK